MFSWCRKFTIRFLCVITLLSASLGCAAQLEYDVIVAGAGTGGIAAAIQAARMGTSVLVIEESSWIGGQMTAAGVATMDDMSGQKSGIYLEFVNAIEQFYRELNKSPYVGNFGNHTLSFEPTTGQKKLYEFVDGVRDKGGKLDIMLSTYITEVEREGKRVAGVRTETDHIKCKVLIDATERGDIIPLAGVPYRAGNSFTPNIDPEAMIQDITWNAVIKYYPDGVPEHLKAKSLLPNYEAEHRRNYTRFVTAKGGNNPLNLPQNLRTHNAYRAMPDSSVPGFFDGRRGNWGMITKTGVNMGNDYPGRSGWAPGRSGLPVKYLEETEVRRVANRRALLKTLNFIYYMQHELEGAGSKWSVADDEYYSDEPLNLIRDLVPPEWDEIVRRMPVIPYVRESRRIMGDTTLTSGMLLRNSLSYRDGRTNLEFQDAIAIGRYNLDLHNAGEPANIETFLGETADSINTDRPRGNFQVPLSVLIPAEVDDFIAAEKNLSMSRLASGALRLQPICMMTGQAAGVLAALAVRKNISPRSVPEINVQWELLNSGVNISLARFRDVPRTHRYNAAVQLALLYKLLEPLSYPHNPSYNISDADDRTLGIPLIKGPALGTFGVDRRLSESEKSQLLSNAPQGFRFPETVTRGEALDMVIRAVVEK